MQARHHAVSAPARRWIRFGICLALLAAPAPGSAIEQAVKAAIERAEAGDVTAMRQLAGAYYHGGQVDKDLEQAARWFRRAADAGDAQSQYDLAGLYYRGEGVAQSQIEGARWLRRAARTGHAEAQQRFEKLVHSGQLFRLAEQEPQKAFELFLEFAEDGEVAAQNLVGGMYLEGIGVRADSEKAVHWFEKAAAQGNRDAQAALGSIYDEGRGIDSDPADALAWYRKAAEAGHAGAQFNLGTLYMNGIGVPVDHTEAVMWLSLAASENASARYLLYTQELKVAPEALAEGRRRAAERGAKLIPITPDASTSPASAEDLEPL